LRRSNCIVGIDVGGANLKLATWQDAAEPKCVSVSFPLWKYPQRLSETAGQLLDQLMRRAGSSAPPDQLAVTMTGELADCYATRREGVQRILSQLCEVLPKERIAVYAVGGRWLNVDQAVEDPWLVAASNWHALASWLVRWPATLEACALAVLVDIGSTTVDVLPLADCRCATSARTDRERLELQQLVYTGLARTPVCAIVPDLIVGERRVPVMAELFATSDDAYLALGLVAEDRCDRDTADGRPRTVEAARARLARMVGEDSETLTAGQINALADQIIAAQAEQVAHAIEMNLSLLSHTEQSSPAARSPRLIFTGHGWPLFERARGRVKHPHAVFALPEVLAMEASRCAPAAAVAWLRALPGGA
jgi:probable H4MPT-linked C1 transfer pathway protein